MSTTERAERRRSGKQSPAEPRSWEDVNQRLAYLGELERQIQALRDRFEQKVAVLQQQLLEASQPLAVERERLQDQIERFYWAHRREVLAEGRKSVELPFGRLGSRLSRSLVVEDAAAAQQWLEAQGLGCFLRTRTEIDREAVRATFLSTNGSGNGQSSAVLACPMIHLQETEQFWYEVKSGGLGGNHQTGREGATSNNSRGRFREATPGNASARAIREGGIHDRVIQ